MIFNVPSRILVFIRQIYSTSGQNYFPDEDAALNAVEVMAKRVKGSAQVLEFFAKRLVYDSGQLTPSRIRPRPKSVLFGTPLYVALAE